MACVVLDFSHTCRAFVCKLTNLIFCWIISGSELESRLFKIPHGGKMVEVQSTDVSGLWHGKDKLALGLFLHIWSQISRKRS